MSKDTVKSMFKKIEADKEFRQKYAAMMQAHQAESEKALAEKIIGLGKNSGFTFSKDDLLAARAELMDKANSNGELSEADLEKVAGGQGFDVRKAVIIGFSVITAGIACGLTSITVELKNGPGGCGRGMTTVDCK
ncbi:MAG TPA: Nif11-like leader peptide family natural product precursor [Candidatus Wallbacteria bacterium]|nr:Nif11-like leader peptide family natural product precursor [Candidatus Wallbacteria bacterium]